MVRATHSVYQGSYYFEVEILTSSGPDAHFRVGWSRQHGELLAPVGFDGHSYGYRDIDGSKIHKSQRVDHFGESYGPNDIIGCYLHLNDDPTLNKIGFFKNGVFQGYAFEGPEVPGDIYFPAVSVYKKVCSLARLLVVMSPCDSLTVLLGG